MKALFLYSGFIRETGALHTTLKIGVFGYREFETPALIPFTARISRDLFLADLELHERRMNGTMPADFSPDLYAHSVWKP